MNSDLFIGMGHNPHGVDLPTGLGMELAQTPEALNCYSHLTGEQRAKVVAYIQGGHTGEEARRRVTEAIENLKLNNVNFF